MYMNLDDYKQGDRLKHKSGRLCTFDYYEIPGCTGKPWQEYPNDHCAWVIFDKFNFKKNVPILVCLSDLTRYDGKK